MQNPLTSVRALKIGNHPEDFFYPTNVPKMFAAVLGLKKIIILNTN